MNPICTNCNVEMNCTENGVTVAHVQTPHWICKGDRFTCPHCSNETIQSFGSAYDSPNEAIVMIEDALSSAELEIIQAPIDWMQEL
jgi:predicted RNA-binding Zn-ribbon protein involved in translation (DUF1610 family)